MAGNDDNTGLPEFLSEGTVEPSERWVRVKFGGEIVADSKRPTLLLQYGPGALPTYFFSREHVRMDLLQASGEHDGKHFWTVKTENPRIKDLLCFFNERVDTYVDGVLLPRPNTPWS